jgi:hypothetical protein
MTQSYEPIKITDSTPEPKEDGIYLLTITQCGERYSVPRSRVDMAMRMRLRPTTSGQAMESHGRQEHIMRLPARQTQAKGHES